MLDLAKVKQRLSAAVPAFARIAVITDIQQALDGGTTYPAAFIRPAGDTPRNPATKWEPRQVVDEAVEIVIVVRNVSDDRGEAAAVELSALSGEVRAALQGYRIEQGRSPLVFAGGRPLGLNDLSLVWSEAFTSPTTLNSAA